MKRTYLRQLFSVTMLFALGLFLSSCDSNPTNPELEEEIELIKQAIMEEEDLINVEGLDDEGAQPPAYDSDNVGKSTDQIEPLRYGRRGRFALESIEVEFDSDTTATATIIHSLNGEFMILAMDSTDSSVVIQPIAKPMTNTIVRKAQLIKVRDTGELRADWRITKVSMVMAESEEPTIDIQEVRVDLPGDTTDIVITDPLNTFFNRHEGIPTLSRGDTVTVLVTLSNSNDFPPEPGETVTLRHRMRRFQRARKTFNDEGVGPDAVAGDGVFTAQFVIRGHFGFHHSAVDVIDHGTLYDDAAPYNSVVWAVPYRVRL